MHASYVIKRDGSIASVHFDEITERLIYLCNQIQPPLENVDPVLVAQKVISGIHPGIRTSELDILAAETSASMTSLHYEYDDLASRILVSNLQKQAPPAFSSAMVLAFHNINTKTKEPCPLLSAETYDIIIKNRDILNSTIVHERDFQYDYSGFKTLLGSYLLDVYHHASGTKKIIETPQYMIMRVAVGIHQNDIHKVIETYHEMSLMLYTHATPTLFNAGTPKPQMSSCFLLCMTEDSIEGIYETLKRCALISKMAGGIGVSCHKIRAKNSYIKGTNGISNGLVPMLRVYNDTSLYVDQGGGKRKGAFAIYLEPWHADIFDFLDLKKNNGKEEVRARNLFYALWVPDLFMKRVEADQHWSLFCPDEAPGLHLVWGEAFDTLYHKYENTPGLARSTIKARDLWMAIVNSQIETGTPYILYKDSCNRKSNQQNLGTIQCSNLCTEIIEYTAPDEVAVCNLASFSLPQFVINGVFDHQKLATVVGHVTENLNKIIDGNYYPIPEAENSNKRHRPIGLGVQGLANLFIKLRLPFESPEARKLNQELFETIYYAALHKSMELAQRDGPYSSFPGSPASQGILQFDMWGFVPTSGRWDWAGLKEKIQRHGLRNSLLVAPMPTASTSQILKNQEGCEPFTSNLFVRRVLSGEFTVVNRQLVKDLMEMGLWNETMKNRIIAAKGSIQTIDQIPKGIKDLYKTIWEIPQKVLIDYAADRGCFIDQSQSLNIFMAQPTYEKLTSMHFYGWKKGLKTGMYYLRTRPATDAVQVTLDPSMTAKPTPTTTQEPEGPVCTKEEGCFVCGS